VKKEEKTVADEPKKKNNHTKWLTTIIVLLIVVGGLGYYLWSRGKISTDDAYVDGHIYVITPRVSGYITDVYITDNQEVKKGQVIVTLDPTPYEVALAGSKAALAEAEATLTSLDLGVPLELTQTDQRVRAAQAELTSLSNSLEMARKQEEAAEQNLKQAKAENEQAVLDLHRMENLRKSNAISQSTLDKAQTLYHTTLAKVRSVKAGRDSLRDHSASLASELARQEANIELAATGKDLAEIKNRQVKAQQAKVELARARLNQAELDLSYTNIVSPTEGFITRKNVEPGQMVSKGQPLAAVVPLNPGEVWVTANYKETQLTDVRHGQTVDIEVDTYPGVTFKGKVDSIMAGTGAAFSLFPPENASGNFVKVVQRIPVKITFEEENHESFPVLRIGMSVVPTIFTKK
jgi:membrane fusion protein, multidrug efflux system